MYDLLITGGRIVDGSGGPWLAGDVAVSGGRIAAIGRLTPADGGPHLGELARVRIDAAGLVVGVRAMELCIAEAKEQELAAVAVRRSRHYGIASYYGLMCPPHDMIGVSLGGSSGLPASVGSRLI